MAVGVRIENNEFVKWVYWGPFEFKWKSYLDVNPLMQLITGVNMIWIII